MCWLECSRLYKDEEQGVSFRSLKIWHFYLSSTVRHKQQYSVFQLSGYWVFFAAYHRGFFQCSDIETTKRALVIMRLKKLPAPWSQRHNVDDNFERLTQIELAIMHELFYTIINLKNLVHIYLWAWFNLIDRAPG